MNMAKKASQTPEEQARTQAILLEIVTCLGPVLTEHVWGAAGIHPPLASWHLHQLSLAGKVESRPRRIGRNKVRMEWVATPGRIVEPPQPKKPQNPNHGIDHSDLEWMEKYRQRYQERQQRLKGVIK